MPAVFKTIINASVWILFIKGVVSVFVTICIMSRAYLSGETTPMVGVATCAAGTFAFAMTCVAAWIRHKVE
jgi:hypothetical protein